MKTQKTAPQLFGLALAPLYLAIAQVESQCGKTSDNVYKRLKERFDPQMRLSI